MSAGPLVVTFAPKRARDVPLYVAGLPIFSKAYYAKQPFEESTLETPLGCGPYKVGRFEVNRFIEFDRVKDWWAAGLPVNRGTYHFDTVRYEFYRDRDVAFERVVQSGGNALPLGLAIHDLAEHSHREARLLELVDQSCELHQRTCDSAREHLDRHQRADRKVATDHQIRAKPDDRDGG